MDSFSDTLITRRELGSALERSDFTNRGAIRGVRMRRIREVVPVVFRGKWVKGKSGLIQELSEDEHDNIVCGRKLRNGWTRTSRFGGTSLYRDRFLSFVFTFFL